jgi:hypothetical protein
MAKCFEFKLFNGTCRIPGYRNPTLLADRDLFGNIPECRNSTDYSRMVTRMGLGDLTYVTDRHQINRECQKICLPCTRVRHTWGSDEAYIGGSEYKKSISVPLGSSSFMSAVPWYSFNSSVPFEISLRATQREVKVIKQEFAYGSNEFLSELGGSWGLFLGMSLVTVFLFIEEAFLAML